MKHYPHNSDLEVIDLSQGPFAVQRITWDKNVDANGVMRNVLDRWHPALEVVYTLIGNAVHYVDGKTYRAHPGSVLVINSGSVHRVISDIAAYSKYPKDTTVAVVFHVDIKYLTWLIPNFEEKYFQPTLAKDDVREAVAMRNMAEISDDVELHKDYIQLKLSSFANNLLYTLCVNRLVSRADAVTAKHRKNMDRLREILQYINEHYQERISQQSVAAHFYFTKEYFSRFFKLNTGMTFVEYLSRRRLQEATRLLQETDDSISSIAQECGFSDSRGLINTFRKFFEITPLQYRLQYRKDESKINSENIKVQ